MKSLKKIESMRLRAILFAGSLLIVATAGVWALKTATPYGLSLRNDSVQYVNGARNLLAGEGYTRTSGRGELKPITTIPPMFSTLIAVVSLTGIEALRSARFLILMLFGMNILLLGYLTWRVSHAFGFALAGAMLFASSSVILSNFNWLMSEPLFVFFLLVIFIVFDVYLMHRKKWVLILLGLLCGIAYLTRYIGITLLVALGIVLLFVEHSWKERLRAVLGLGLPFIPFFAGWMIHNTIQIGNPANRSFLVHPVTPEKIIFGIDNFWDWLLPDILSRFYLSYQGAFHVVFYILIATLLVGLAFALYSALKSARARDQATDTRRLLPLGMYIPVYICMTLFSMSFIDASTILDHRLLIPVYVPVLILLMAGLNWLFQHKALADKVISVLIVLVALSFSIVQGWNEVKNLSRDGYGFAMLDVKFSPTMNYIRNLPPTVIYTNKPFMVYIVTDRNAYLAPSPYDPVTATEREDYQQNLEDMREVLKEEASILVFYKDKGYAEDPWFIDLTRGLVLDREYWDALIYRANK